MARFFSTHPSRADNFSESVIREMTRLSLKHNAINLAQGFPDFPCPAELKVAACAAVNEDYNPYAITWGAQDLREALAARVKKFNGMDFDPQAGITVTCGSTEAMMASMLAIIQPGDEVIVPEPFYENYGPDAQISGAVPPHLSSMPVLQRFSCRMPITMSLPGNTTGNGTSSSTG
jgi:aminotransferase